MSFILVVDDSAFSRKTIRSILLKLGHAVDEAADGSLGLQKAAETQYDCIFTDLLMPGMSGLEVLERLQGQPVPVVVVSADIQTTTRDRCLERGAVVVINKPVDENKLRSALDTIFSVSGGH